ncbi:hypothetical protein [Streptomyces showdoensis]|uniref:Uncharacterized protein n=1 Tax=Streptomyces showdoensis TaxID=68268 RepID=A0A2P2GTP5_STREW|nr:hypothetical protein [Streptomyces showdoensis]KKZ74868.1 hypothetical protein VO63_05310 [Streptomyces showdoensis]
MADRITTSQLLNLADRSERGLTTAEASRLRAGIAQLHDERASLRNRLRVQTRRRNIAVSKLSDIHRLATLARERGNATVPTWAVDACLSDASNQEAA